MCTIFLSILFLQNFSVLIAQNSYANKKVVLIFDGYVKGSSVVESDIYFSKANDFRVDYVYPMKAQDTVVVNPIQSKMILTHVFDFGVNYSYEFQKGDTVKFEYKNGLPRVSLVNKRTVLKHDLNFEDDFKSIKRPSEPLIFSMKNKRNRTEDENIIYEKELSDYFVTRDNKLDALFSEELISPTIYAIHKGRNKFLKVNLNKADFDFGSVPESDLVRDNLLPVKTYKYFLENYIIGKYNVRKVNAFDYDNKQAFDVAFSDNMLSYKTKSYLLFLFLNAIANSKDKGSLTSYFEKFKTFEKGAELSQSIKDSYLLDLDALKKETKQVVLLDDKKRKTTLEEFIVKQTGKVVYVDFWASWCAPCRASFPYSHKLLEELKGKDVVFLYLSTDENFEAWKKANSKENLPDVNSFYLMNTKASEFIQKLTLKSIPRYLLFDQEGKLVNENASGPKEEKCKLELLKPLKK